MPGLWLSFCTSDAQIVPLFLLGYKTQTPQKVSKEQRIQTLPEFADGTCSLEKISWGSPCPLAAQ